MSDRFIIPKKLYGREAEVQALLAAFERVSGGSAEMMLVTGFSGIGKTAVVNEVHKARETDAKVEQWKTQILAALGENAQVVVDVIPELERIIDSTLDKRSRTALSLLNGSLSI
ncbi:AAA family ATPase [Trichocoleus sp. FACHB-90]|uniref:AAA family ATPase n=1 Tax=Trichocoleus sp. FACHB-90 TaxID=2692876 RepID=UPI001688711B|nr:AAA family ATPase [Trichocoleus sp. FACHB-90]MBD1927371.1 AAA family ATPase [Trichocoleus sp. FACHB-90]